MNIDTSNLKFGDFESIELGLPTQFQYALRSRSGHDVIFADRQSGKTYFTALLALKRYHLFGHRQYFADTKANYEHWLSLVIEIAQKLNCKILKGRNSHFLWLNESSNIQGMYGDVYYNEFMYWGMLEDDESIDFKKIRDLGDALTVKKEFSQLAVSSSIYMQKNLLVHLKEFSGFQLFNFESNILTKDFFRR